MAASLCACVDKGGKNEKQKVRQSLDLSVKLKRQTMNVKSVGAINGEDIVNDICLMFFDYSSNGEGKYIGAYRISEEDGNAKLLPSDGRLTFDLVISSAEASFLQPNTAYSVRAMANMFGSSLFADHNAMTAFLDDCAGKTENQIVRGMTRPVYGVDFDTEDNSRSVDSYNIPMSCAFQLEANQSQASVNLERTLARFDLLFDNTQESTKDYELVSASVWNTFARPNFWGDVAPDYAARAYTKRYYGVQASEGEQHIIARLYTTENVSTEPRLNDSITTCLVVGLRNKTTDKTYYYRLNIHEKGEAQYLKRNNVYQSTIIAIHGEGASNERDAYTRGSFGLSVVVSPWVSDENGLIMTNDDLMLALPTQRIMFGPKATEKRFFVFTKNKGEKEETLKMAPLDLPEGVTARLEGQNLFVNCSDFTGVEQSGSLELIYGPLKGIIEIYQSGKEEAFLELNYNKVANYPAGMSKNMIPFNNPITIKSSGPWKASIVGDEVFSFDMDHLNTEVSGDNLDKITAAYNLTPNPTQKARTNVLLIELESDPENFRNVVVLTQEPSGTYTVTPALPKEESLYFNADGELIPNAQVTTNEFKLASTGKFDSWSISLSGNNANKFQIVALDESMQPIKTYAPGEEYNLKPAGKLNFRLEPIGTNYGTEHLANLDIYYNGRKATAAVKQDAYELSQNPGFVSGISTEDNSYTITSNMEGSSSSSLTKDVALKVVMPAGILEDEKKIIRKNYSPSFQSGGQYLSDLAIEAPFTVNIPQQGPPFGHLFKGSAIVEALISVPGVPELSRTVQFIQDAVPMPAAIYVQSVNSSNASIPSNSEDHFSKMDDLMGNTDDFGPTGAVWTPPIDFKPGEYTHGESENKQGFRIFNSCQNQAYGPSVIEYWKANKNTVMLASHLNQDAMDKLQAGYHVRTTSSYDKFISYADYLQEDSKLWRYMFFNGPFGAADHGKISETLTTTNLDLYSLAKYPTTFIPIVFDAVRNKGYYCTLGIDPTHRLIWIGDTDIFQGPASNFEGEKLIFMKNFISYIYNVALYGDLFNQQFIEERSTGTGGNMEFE